MKTVNITLNAQQISLLLGTIFEYRNQIGYDEDSALADQVEEILENAENEVCQ